MKKKQREAEKTPYIDEDLLFLMLKLANYPFKKKRAIEYHELRGQQDDAGFIRMMEVILRLRELLGGIEIPDLKINTHFFSKAKRNRIKTAFEFLKKQENKDSHKEMSGILDVFSFIDYDGDDIRVTLGNALADILSSPREVGFTINVSESNQNKITHVIQFIAQEFINDRFASSKFNFYTFSQHKSIGFKYIVQSAKRFGNELILKVSDFDKYFRLAEFVVALNELGYLDIVAVSITKEEASLEEKIGNVRIAGTDAGKEIEEAIRFVKTAHDLFNRSAPEARRELIETLSSNIGIKDRKVAYFSLDDPSRGRKKT